MKENNTETIWLRKPEYTGQLVTTIGALSLSLTNPKPQPVVGVCLHFTVIKQLEMYTLLI